MELTEGPDREECGKCDHYDVDEGRPQCSRLSDGLLCDCDMLYFMTLLGSRVHANLIAVAVLLELFKKEGEGKAFSKMDMERAVSWLMLRAPKNLHLEDLAEILSPTVVNLLPPEEQKDSDESNDSPKP